MERADEDIAHAARNNAAWCEAVAAAHDIDSTFDDVAWTSGRRSPPAFPDAVTLVPDVDVSHLLARIDASPGCSIKDSFATLDLAGHGFDVLFDATWLVAEPAAAVAREPDALPWSVVPGDAVATWLDAWRAAGGDPDGLRPAALRRPAVTVVAPPAGSPSGGAVLTRTGAVVGISNMFTAGELDAAWARCLAVARRSFPGAFIVSYEHGPALDAAIAAGCSAAGPLRVWVHGSLAGAQADSSSSP